MSLPGREPLIDIIKGSVATLVLFLAFVTLPMIGLLPGLFAPLPAIFYSLKGDRISGAAIVVIVAAILGLMADTSTIALYLLQSGSLSLALPFFLRAGKGAARALAYSVTINLALILVLGIAFGALRGESLDRKVQQGIKASIAQTATFYEKAGLKGDDLETLQQGLTQAGAVIGRVYPAMMIISLVIVAGLNMLMLARLAGRLPRPPEIGSFLSFKNPEPLVWALIAAGFSMLLPVDAVSRIALNVLIVIVFMYLIQGLAVTAHFFGRFAVPFFMRVIFYVLLLVQPYLAIGLAIVGIFDIWGDFRHPKPKNL